MTLGGKFRFNLRRRFGVVGLLAIVVVAGGHSALLSGYVTDLMLAREAQVTREFILNVLRVDDSIGLFSQPTDPVYARNFSGSILHLTSIPEVQRINVYARDRTVLWSTDPAIIGRHFEGNGDLDMALLGQLVVEGGRISEGEQAKPEHVGLTNRSRFFVETYIPVTRSGESEVLGVVELYKAPEALTAAITQGHRRVWLGAVAGGLILYLSLIWLVQNADRQITGQQKRLADAEALAAVGELATMVAHNVRNPLASIRSTSELYRESGSVLDPSAADDMIASVDQIESWLRELTGVGTLDEAPAGAVDVGTVLRDCVASLQRTGVRHIVATGEAHASAVFSAPLLEQVLNCLLANAIDATEAGGTVTASVHDRQDAVEVSVADTGCGIAPEHMAKLFSLFFTTKATGLGIGLALARRSAERFGGTLTAASSQGAGAVFTLRLRKA